jgi:hypothetical protein
VNTGVAQWTNLTTGQTSCISVHNPVPGVYYYRLFAAGSADFSFKTAFILNGPGTCSLPDGKRNAVDAHDL